MDIILIGLPGCGKSAVGRRTAQRMSMPFIDMDLEIEKSENRPISEIFAADGEDYFRRIETDCLKKVLGKGSVIATGGGIVVRAVNTELLRDSDSVVVFLDRPPEHIAGDVRTDTRPLLKDGAERIYKLFEERNEKYLSLCDIRIVNDKTAEDAVDELYDKLKAADALPNK